MRFSLFNMHANRMSVGIEIATFGYKDRFDHSLFAIVWTSCDGWWIDLLWFSLNIIDGYAMLWGPNKKQLK